MYANFYYNKFFDNTKILDSTNVDLYNYPYITADTTNTSTLNFDISEYPILRDSVSNYQIEVQTTGGVYDTTNRSTYIVNTDINNNNWVSGQDYNVFNFYNNPFDSTSILEYDLFSDSTNLYCLYTEKYIENNAHLKRIKLAQLNLDNKTFTDII